MSVLTECEGQLLALIEKLRNVYKLTNVLDAQYQLIRNQRRKIVLAVAGGLKAGKSSFINYLIGSVVCPVGINETTARLTKVTYGPEKLVKLESNAGELKEEYRIINDEELKAITKKLIALKGASRDESSCQDIVTIYLDRRELEGIELWDISGYDENPYLNSIIENILKEANIFFILTSITEAVRDTTVSLFRSCLEKHEYQPQVCFVATKIDQVTTNQKAEETIQDVLDSLFQRIKDRFEVDIGDEWKSSPFFIPLCTDPTFSMKDFLESQEQFTQKLTQFFTNAVRNHTIRRLKYLINMIHELLDYDDLDRSIQREDKLSNTLTSYLNELRIRLDEELKQPFLEIHTDVAIRASKKTADNDDMLRKMLLEELKEALQENSENIDQSISECLNEFLSNLAQNPTLAAVIHSLGEQKLYGDPYEAVVGQYKNGQDSLLRSARLAGIWSYTNRFMGIFQPNSVGLNDEIFRKISHDLETSSIAALFVSVGISAFLFSISLFRVPFAVTGKYSLVSFSASITKSALLLLSDEMMADDVKSDAQSSVEEIIQGLIKQMINNVHRKICDQLGNINEGIKRRKLKLSEKKNIGEAQVIAQFLKDNTSSIVQLYLNLLDKANRFEYPHCEIDPGDVLGRSNFPVFGGKLGDTDRGVLEKIAAKRVPLRSFSWQEVRYMNEFDHENILHYYGVRKTEHIKEEHYDILMKRLDSDLPKYIEYALKKEKINDQLLNDIFIQITSGLNYLHEQGVIHRDIKPENVLVQLKKGQSPICVIADFGFVHRVPISIKGTLGFLAPELVKNPESTFITTKIDIFALGATIQRTIEKSKADTEGKYVKFWLEISKRCLLDDLFHRPTCQQILDEHRNLIA